MMKKIKGYKILQGARGKKGMDIMALVDTIIKFSHLCIDTSELFEEIDINPLIVGESGHGARVVDALMVPR